MLWTSLDEPVVKSLTNFYMMYLEFPGISIKFSVNIIYLYKSDILPWSANTLHFFQITTGMRQTKQLRVSYNLAKLKQTTINLSRDKFRQLVAF